MERERLNRSFALLEEHLSLQGKHVVDLGCGGGIFSRRLRDVEAKVDAVDIAKNALITLESEDTTDIKAIHDYVPRTRLEDSAYDLVVCTDLIAHLPNKEHRLFISELARLVKGNGYILCSTPIDIHSEDALKRFSSLAETELQIIRWKLSYHRLFIRLRDLFEAPSRYARARKDREYRENARKESSSFSRWWFQLNSAPLLGGFWALFQYLTNPIASLLRQNRVILLFLEAICRLLWRESGVSHAIFLAKRRPLVMKLTTDTHR